MILTLRFPLRKIVILCTLMSWLSSLSQTTVFNDDFTTSQGTYYTTAAGFIGTSTVWRNARSGTDFGSGIANSHLSLINDTGGTLNSNGWVLGYTNSSDFPAPYNTTLANNPGTVTWSFTMRQSNSNPSGFAAAEYGMAFILAGTAGTTNVTGTGYAVVLGNSGTTDPVRLVRYNSGIRNFTNLITSNTTGLTDFGVQYISVRVTYTPSTNTWQLFLRNDGTSPTVDPTSGTLVSQGTVVNNNYTGTALPLLGGYLNAGTVRQTAFFDYVRVTVGIPTLISISPNTRTAGTGAFTLTLTGSGFTNTSIARWNGANRTTTYVSPTQLTVAIPAADILSSGTAAITVANGTTISNSLPLIIEPAGVASLTPSVSSLSFATTVTGTASTTQQYTLSGQNLTSDAVVTAPANFEISRDGGTSYATSLTLPRTGNILTGQPITITARVRATAPAGVYSGSITHNATGATEKIVTVSAKVLAAEPTIQSTAVTFTNVTSSGFTVNWSAGNGGRRIVLVRQASAVNSAPVDGQSYNALSAFGSGSQIGTGNYVVYAGTGTSVDVTGLSPATTYHVAVYEYAGTNATENYRTASPALGNRTTLNAPNGWQIYTANSVNTINFDTTVDGVNRDAFQGDGLIPNPQTGTLDSRAWAISGFSDAAINFGGSNVEDGDYDRGVSEGDVPEAGLYSFETAPDNFSLGVQASTGEFTPGTITLRVQNQTGTPVSSINLGYKVYVYNDQPVSSSFGLSYSTDNITYTPVSGVAVVSPAAADVTPGWKGYYRVVTFPISVGTNNYCYLRWTGATVSGSGEADEFALDDIELVVNSSGTYVPFNGNAESFALLGNATLSGDLSVNSELVFNGGKLGLNGRTLTLNGAVTNTVTGGLTGGGLSNIVMGGATNATLSFDQTAAGTSNALNNLSINTSGVTTTSIATPVVVNGDLSVSTDQTLNLGTNALSGTLASINIDGTLLTQNNTASPFPSGKIWGGNGIVHYNAASDPQIVVTGTYNNLTTSSTGGAVAGGALTVNGILNLPTANPSATAGSLAMGNYNLTLGGNATNTGIGDVTGTVLRNSIVANKLYTFGHANTSIVFPNVGTLPTSMGLKIDIGTAPSWRTGAIRRIYDLTQLGGSGTKAVIQAHYLDSELNGNEESKLVDFAYIVGSSTLLEQGRSNYNTTENWVELTNINVGLYFTNTFGQVQLTLDEMATGFLTWNGSISDSWTTAQNWTPNATPSDNTKVIIPDAATTPRDPILNPTVTVGAITIEPGGIVRTPVNSQLIMTGGAGAWLNNGDFQAGTGTNRVTFTNLDASIAGETTFNNITIASGAGLRPLTGNVMKIEGEFSRIGNFSAGSIDNTVEYKGTNQNVATLTGTLAAYNNLIISGAGAVFPTPLNITGDLTLNSPVDFSGKTITMNGPELQTIGGTSSPAFNNLVINNTEGGVSLATNVSVTGILTLTSGVLSINNSNLTLANAVSGTFDVTRMIATDGSGEVRRSLAGTGSYFFPIGEKTSNPSYSPITVAVTSGTFSNAYVGVSVVDSTHPNNGSTQNYISRYWKVNQSGITGAVATVTANYVAAEVLVPESTMVAAQLIGTFNQLTNPWIKFAPLANNTLTATGATLPAGQTSVFTGLKGGDFTALITGYGAFCLNQTATLSTSLTGGDGPYAYSWSGGLGTGSTATPPTTVVGSTDYTLTVRDANGFVATNTATVTVLPTSLGGSLTGTQFICTNSKPNDIQLSGHTGDVIYWQSAPTSGFASPTNISNTTTILTGDAIGPLQATTFFRAVISNGSCGEIYSGITSATIKTTTWDGTTWSAGAPDASTNAVLTGPYSGIADLVACSLTINNNAAVTLASGVTATLNGAILVNSGSFTLEDSASLVQTDDEAVNVGANFTMKRNAQPMYRYDFTYWSSPVEGQTLYNLSPATLADKYLGWNASTEAWVTYLNGNHTMVSGAGYIVRAPQTYSTNPNTTTTFAATFTGKPHNGVINIPIIGGEASNLLGNPYPSAIDADAFLTNPGNSAALDGTLYFWTHNSAPVNSGSGSYAYSPDDYAVYNLAGGTGTAAPSETSPNADNTPSGMIASGQAFFAVGTSYGIATFDDSMRTAGNNSQFFRSPNNANATSSFERHRIWCSARGANATFKQVLIAYATGGTEEYDRGLDGEFFSDSGGLSLYSLGASKKLSIQSLGLPFDTNSAVLLGFKATDAGSYTIALDKFDGLFQNQDVFLHDKTMEIYHDLKASEYSFVTNAGTFDDRFEIVYRDAGALGVGEFELGNSIIVFKDLQQVKVVSSRIPIKAVEVSDMQGRIIYKRKGLDSTSIVLDGLYSERQVLIVNITTEDDRIVSKKIIF